MLDCKEKHMKRVIAYAVLAVAFVFVTALQAEACGKNKPGNGGSSSFAGERGGKFLAGLNLTDEQKAQAQALMQKQREAFKSGDKEQIKAAMVAFRQGLESILTADQKAKLAEMKGQFQGKMGDFKGRFGGEGRFGGCQKKGS
jgi:Spy/CpxP family protein refolding chaperone